MRNSRLMGAGLRVTEDSIKTMWTILRRPCPSNKIRTMSSSSLSRRIRVSLMWLLIIGHKSQQVLTELLPNPLQRTILLLETTLWIDLRLVTSLMTSSNSINSSHTSHQILLLANHRPQQLLQLRPRQKFWIHSQAPRKVEYNTERRSRPTNYCSRPQWALKKVHLMTQTLISITTTATTTPLISPWLSQCQLLPNSRAPFKMLLKKEPLPCNSLNWWKRNNLNLLKVGLKNGNLSISEIKKASML